MKYRRDRRDEPGLGTRLLVAGLVIAGFLFAGYCLLHVINLWLGD